MNHLLPKKRKKRTFEVPRPPREGCEPSWKEGSLPDHEGGGWLCLGRGGGFKGGGGARKKSIHPEKDGHSGECVVGEKKAEPRACVLCRKKGILRRGRGGSRGSQKPLLTPICLFPGGKERIQLLKKKKENLSVSCWRKELISR